MKQSPKKRNEASSVRDVILMKRREFNIGVPAKRTTSTVSSETSTSEPERELRSKKERRGITLNVINCG